MPDKKKLDEVGDATLAISRPLQKELVRIQREVHKQFPGLTPLGLVSATAFSLMEIASTMIYSTSGVLFPEKPEVGDHLATVSKEYFDFFSDKVRVEVETYKKLKVTADKVSGT